ncbi:hypothetical protein FHU28_005610 [Micromonospora echinospora]|uniref:Uncharacterized protein n=1 Tax=Micromonospora echinospora TaxID=1877 RepID=A0ABR6MK51_MICEC|nr:hypothetical protein [Micromonospora echinospora]
MPPRKPLTLDAETVVWANANGPRVASMEAVVGAGPRS